MLNIKIKTIPHKEQRYDTAGDYWKEKDGSIEFRISKMAKTDYEYLVAMHELTEMYLCKKRGISFKSIDKFDMDHPELEDPGADPRAPYHKEHMLALKIEKTLANALGVDWKAYEASFAKLG